MMRVGNQDSTSLTTLTHTLEQVMTSTLDPITILEWVLLMVMVVTGQSMVVVTKHSLPIEWKLEVQMVLTSIPHQLDYQVIRDQLFYVQMVTNSGLIATVYLSLIHI